MDRLEHPPPTTARKQGQERPEQGQQCPGLGQQLGRFPEAQAEKSHVKQGVGTFQVWLAKSTCEFLSQLDHFPPLAGCWGCSLAPGPSSQGAWSN